MRVPYGAGDGDIPFPDIPYTCTVWCAFQTNSPVLAHSSLFLRAVIERYFPLYGKEKAVTLSRRILVWSGRRESPLVRA